MFWNFIVTIQLCLTLNNFHIVVNLKSTKTRFKMHTIVKKNLGLIHFICNLIIIVKIHLIKPFLITFLFKINYLNIYNKCLMEQFLYNFYLTYKVGIYTICICIIFTWWGWPSSERTHNYIVRITFKKNIFIYIKWISVFGYI